MLKTNYGDLPVEIDANGRARVVRIGESKAPAAGERSACTPSELARSNPRGNRTHAEATTRTLQNGSSSTYASKTEAAYAQHLAALQHAGEIRAWWYQPFSFALSNGKRYRPDFVIEYPGGLERRPCCVEVKGWHANRRDSLTHLAWAADKFPFFCWVLVTRDKGQWIEKGIV